MKKLIFIELNEINFDFILKYQKNKKLIKFFNKDFFSNLKLYLKIHFAFIFANRQTSGLGQNYKTFYRR